jgi:hypothetical protein
MGQKTGKHKKDLTQLTEDEIVRLTKNTTYSKQQIQDWHQGFLRYEEKITLFLILSSYFIVIVQMVNLKKRNS